MQKIKKQKLFLNRYAKNFLLTLFFLFLFSFSFLVLEIKKEISLINDSFNFKININSNRIKLRSKINEITAGYPISEMSYYLSFQNKEVVAFMIAIAKKESNWGKRTPKLNGKECYNYWGFRRKRNRMGSGGHTCFDNKKDAVLTVSERIKNLLAQGIDTPQKMVIWKCGYSCDNQNPKNVDKWIRDVDLYYSKF